MPDQTRTASIEELRRLIQDKEHELSQLDLMLADYLAEHSRLIRELCRLWEQLNGAQEKEFSKTEQ